MDNWGYQKKLVHACFNRYMRAVKFFFRLLLISAVLFSTLFQMWLMSRCFDSCMFICYSTFWFDTLVSLQKVFFSLFFEKFKLFLISRHLSRWNEYGIVTRISASSFLVYLGIYLLISYVANFIIQLKEFAGYILAKSYSPNTPWISSILAHKLKSPTVKGGNI